MNALFAILLWFAELASPGTALVSQDGTSINPDETAGVHIINVNPRTVVALEDTHFRPGQ
jgi:hypothetical protein